MKQGLVVAVIWFTCGCSSKPATTPPLVWERFDGGPQAMFQIEMPGKPTQSFRWSTNYGLMMNSCLVETATDVYEVAYADIPRGGDFYADMIKTSLPKRTGAALLREREFKLDLYSAFEYEFETPSPKGFVTMRFVHGVGRAYGLTVSGPQARADHADVRRFFLSFRLTGFAGGPLSFKE